MRSLLVALAFAVALASTGTPAMAVAQQDTAAGPRFREAFASLGEGHTIKVLRTSGTTVGQYVNVVGDSLTMRMNDGPTTTLALDDVSAAWTRKHNAGKGALIGGIVGVVLGGLLGAGAQSLCTGLGESGSDCGSPGGAVVVGALLFGGLSTGIGALIGAAIPGWKPIGPHE